MITTMILLLQMASPSTAAAPSSTRPTAIGASSVAPRTTRPSTTSAANPRVNARIETRVDSRVGGSTPTPPRPSYTPLYGRPR
jgi:hypothetical protein